MSQRILIATKNRIAGDALQLTLSEQGYTVKVYYRNLLSLDQRLKVKKAEIVILGESVVHLYYQKLIQSLKSLDPIPQIAFILDNRTAGFVVRGLQKGVEGFVHKGSGLTDLVKCIQALKNGCTYISPLLSGKITVNDSSGYEQDAELTCREEEIILLVKENRTSREIGKILNLSTKTIQNHRQNMCNKLGLKGRNRLYEYALKNY